MNYKSIYLAAVTAATVPALLGLWGNASFSQDVPVRVPAVAQLADDHSNEPSHSATTPSGTSTTGDDHGVDGPTATTTTTEPGEDHGALKSGMSGSGDGAVSATQGGGHEAATLGKSAATVVSATSGKADSPDTSGSSGSGHSGSSGSGSSGSGGHGSDG